MTIRDAAAASDRLLVATTNPGKLAEIAAILSGIPFALASLNDCAPLVTRLPQASGKPASSASCGMVTDRQSCCAQTRTRFQ